MRRDEQDNVCVGKLGSKQTWSSGLPLNNNQAKGERAPRVVGVIVQTWHNSSSTEMLTLARHKQGTRVFAALENILK